MQKLSPTTSDNPPVTGRALAATIGRNTFFGVVAKVAQASTRLITVPAVIAHLGLDGYGIWSIIMAVAAYMRFGSVGIKSAFQKYVASATGNGDYDSASELLSTGCLVMLLLSLCALIPACIFSTYLARAAGVPAGFIHSAGASISILAVIMMISNVGAVYEAIVMGGHRIDLARNFATFFTVSEAVAILVLLHLGGGLIAMAAVMAISELGFITCNFVASKRVMPRIRVRFVKVRMAVLAELIRFGGTYQLANVFEVLYLGIVPITVLRAFGSHASGVYAVTSRLVQSAQILPDALLIPILSGGAMVYAAGSAEQMQSLIVKSFKVSIGLSLFPLAAIAVFGKSVILAWTGQSDSSFGLGMLLLCAAALFQSFSTLGLVLYRTTGKAFLDNIRQILRIGILLVMTLFARRWGFIGVLAGLTLSELLGALFMLFAIQKTFPDFRGKLVVNDAFRLGVAATMVILAAAAGAWFPYPASEVPRLGALYSLARATIVGLLAIWPALSITRALNQEERMAFRRILFRPRAGGRPTLSPESL